MHSRFLQIQPLPSPPLRRLRFQRQSRLIPSRPKGTRQCHMTTAPQAPRRPRTRPRAQRRLRRSGRPLLPRHRTRARPAHRRAPRWRVRRWRLQPSPPERRSHSVTRSPMRSTVTIRKLPRATPRPRRLTTPQRPSARPGPVWTSSTPSPMRQALVRHPRHGRRNHPRRNARIGRIGRIVRIDRT